MKKLTSLALIALMAVPAFAGSPSNGFPAKARTVPNDGNSDPFTVGAPDLGLKVWELQGTTQPSQLLDENGQQVIAGQFVGVAFGTVAALTDTFLAFDSAVATGLTTSSVNRAIIPPLFGTQNAASFLFPGGPYGVQFNQGLVTILSNAADRAYVYWRPLGGRN